MPYFDVYHTLTMHTRTRIFANTQEEAQVATFDDLFEVIDEADESEVEISRVVVKPASGQGWPGAKG